MVFCANARISSNSCFSLTFTLPALQRCWHSCAPLANDDMPAFERVHNAPCRDVSRGYRRQDWGAFHAVTLPTAGHSGLAPPLRACEQSRRWGVAFAIEHPLLLTQGSLTMSEPLPYCHDSYLLSADFDSLRCHASRKPVAASNAARQSMRYRAKMKSGVSLMFSRLYRLSNLRRSSSSVVIFTIIANL